MSLNGYVPKGSPNIIGGHHSHKYSSYIIGGNYSYELGGGLGEIGNLVWSGVKTLASRPEVQKIAKDVGSEIVSNVLKDINLKERIQNKKGVKKSGARSKIESLLAGHGIKVLH
jgi:hypothetical protein